MNKYKKVFHLKSGSLVLVLLNIFFIADTTNGQTIDSLLNEASRNNPQLKAYEQRITAAEYKSESAGYLPPPSVGIEFQQVPFKEPDPLKNAISQNLVFSQMFMLGGKLGAMYEAEKQNVPIAQNEYMETKLKVLTGIREQYYKIWMNEHHLELREEISSILKDLLTSAENSYKVNRTRYSDLLLLRSEIASNETEIISLNNDLQAEVYKMNYLLGRDLNDSSLTVQHTWKIDSLQLNEDQLASHLSRHNPTLKKMSSMITMNELEQKANSKELFPDLMLQGMVMRMPRGMILTTKTDPMMRMELGETEYMYSIMASVTLPFMPWSSGKINNRNEELAAGIGSLNLERNNMEREMFSNLRGLLKKINSRKAQVQLYETNVIPLFNQTLEAQLSDYRNNQLPISSIMDTFRTLLRKEEELAEIKMEHQMLMADIYMMLGSGDNNEN